MGAALLNLAGSHLQTGLVYLTKTPLRGALFGAAVTAIIQSSSATTAITVAAVNGGLLTVRQSLALIAGANVGTTITAQLAALSLKQIVLPAIAVGLLLQLIPQGRNVGFVLIGLGMLFGGLQLMSDNLSQLLHLPFVDALFKASNNSPCFGLLVGIVATAIVQSSSAVTGLVIALAASHALDLPAAMGIALGSNIGTCATALLASWNTKRSARQVAWAHLLFNVIGVAAVLPFYVRFLDLVKDTAPDVMHQIANGHTLFNLISALLFLVLIAPIAGILERFA